MTVDSARRTFAWVFALTLALKLALAAMFPMTGDEAFFYQWGVHPAWGYSDHPPMVGWWLAVLRLLGDSTLALRLATVAVTSVIALGVVDLARRWLPAEREASAWMAGAAYLALPWSWLFVLVTTDTPLVFFMAVSAWCYLRADQCQAGGGRVGWYALAGLFVGLAFLSKYFAALLGLAYAVHVLGWRRERWWSLPLMFALALPSIAVNLLYNAWHGWSNIMFNFLNRNEGTDWGWENETVYLLMLAYLLTPWLLWRSLRARGLGVPPASRTVLVLWLFPLLVFALLGLRRSIGLHWVLGFVPLFVLWAGLRLDADALKRALRWNVVLSVPHVLAVAALLFTPLAWWAKAGIHEKLVFLREGPAIVSALRSDLPADAGLMARAYSPAAVLSYYSGRYVPVFGVGRHHARQDDWIVDFREWNGRRVRLFDRNPFHLEEFAPFFERVSARSFVVEGVTYYVLDGEGFRYQPYRDQVLAEIARRFHQIPAGLPVEGNPFCERYGFADCAPGRPGGR